MSSINYTPFPLFYSSGDAQNSKIMNFIVLLPKALFHKGLKQLFMIFYFELYFVLNFIFLKLIV